MLAHVFRDRPGYASPGTVVNVELNLVGLVRLERYLRVALGQIHIIAGHGFWLHVDFERERTVRAAEGFIDLNRSGRSEGSR